MFKPKRKFGNMDSMPGDWLFKVVPIFIGLVFLFIIIGYYVFLGVVAKKAYNAIGDCGIPAVVVSNDGHGNQSYSVKCADKDQTK